MWTCTTNVQEIDGVRMGRQHLENQEKKKTEKNMKQGLTWNQATEKAKNNKLKLKFVYGYKWNMPHTIICSNVVTDYTGQRLSQAESPGLIRVH